MRFAFTPDQDLLRDTVRSLFADVCTPEALRAAAVSEDGRVEGLWPALADMGVLAALVPEPAGGLGLSEIDMVRVLEEAGFAGMPEPLTEHAAVAVPALAESRAGAGSGGAAGPDTAPLGSLLADALAGRSLVTVALDDAPVPAAATADAVVVDTRPHGGGQQADDDVWRHSAAGAKGNGLVAATSWTSTPLASLDESRRLARIAISRAMPLPGADAELARDRAALGAAAQCVGVARRLLDMTVGYVAERHQFGRPVGSYQAVKHHLADVRIAIEFAAPLVYRAAWTVARSSRLPAATHAGSPAEPSAGPAPADAEARGRHVSMAKAMASDAVDRACRSCLQCHGAIGYTAEHDLQLWLKRGWALSAAHGDARSHRRRVADSLGI